jgi:hypothetical protein
MAKSVFVDHVAKLFRWLKFYRVTSAYAIVTALAFDNTDFPPINSNFCCQI